LDEQQTQSFAFSKNDGPYKAFCSGETERNFSQYADFHKV